MARQPMVTRTIQSTKVHTLCVNIAEQKTFETDYIIARTYKDNASLEKALSKIVTDSNTKVVSILSSEVLEERYGMTEQEFLASAHKL